MEMISFGTFMVLLIGSFPEIYCGWKVKIPIIFQIRPTVCRLTRIYSAKPEKILRLSFSNMREILVSVDREDRTLFFIRKPFWYRLFEMRSSWPLLGTIEFSEIDGKTKALIEGKPPFTTTYSIPVFVFAFVVIGCKNGDINLGISFLFIMFMVVMLGLSYFIERARFFRHVNAIETVMKKKGIERLPQSDAIHK